MPADIIDIRTGKYLPAKPPPMSLRIASVMAQAMEEGDKAAFDILNDALMQYLRVSDWRSRA